VSWATVYGHDEQKRAFARIVKRGRLAHAYLFVGPSGIGKFRFARELAKALLCEGRSESTFDACDSCTACTHFAAGSHPDSMSVARPDDGLDIPIETIRDLSRELSLKPARGHRKIAIIDDADDLSDTSANCFLKTLEEPPPGSLLILIGTSTHRQLPTIVSRCQRVDFHLLSTENVARVLQDRGDVEADQVDSVARLSGGRPGRATAAADLEFARFRQRLLASFAGPPGLAALSAKEWMEFLEESGKEAAAHRQRALQITDTLIGFFGTLLNGETEPNGNDLTREEQAVIGQLAGRISPQRAVEVLERCLEAENHIDRRVQLVLAIEGFVFDLKKLLNPRGAAL
jgi:DNA polymerase-3 subunit delta'